MPSPENSHLVMYWVRLSKQGKSNSPIVYIDDIETGSYTGRYMQRDALTVQKLVDQGYIDDLDTQKPSSENSHLDL